MKADIKLNSDSVEVEGPLMLQRIISKDLAVAGGLSVVGVGEHIADGFRHLVLKPDSLVIETHHITAGIKRFDFAKEIIQNTNDLKQVSADAKTAAAGVKAIEQRTNWRVTNLDATNAVRVGMPLELAPVNTQIPQLVLSANKIIVRRVTQPGTIDIIGGGSPLGTPFGPPQIVDFDLLADHNSLKQKVAAVEQRTDWKMDSLQVKDEIKVGPPPVPVPPNTRMSQVIISSNRVVVRTVFQPPPASTPGGLTRPPVITNVDLVAENQTLKQQVSALEQRLARLETRVVALEAKVK